MKKGVSFSLLTALLGLSLGALAGCGGQAQSVSSASASGLSSSATSQTTETSHSHSSESDHSSHSHSDSSQSTSQSQSESTHSHSDSSQSHSDSSHSHSDSSQSSIPHVHEWGDPVWEWTKVDDGYTAKATFTCTIDPTHVEVVNATVALDHETAPTCEQAGEVVYNAALRFEGASFTQTRTDVIQATGHRFSEDWESSATEHWHVCLNHGCTAIDGKAAHTLDTRIVTTPATCDKEGEAVEETFCTVCGTIVKTETTKIDKLQHDYKLSAEDSVEPTCTAPGSKVYKCTLCGASYSEKLTALGHDWKAGEKCTDPYTCTRCEATKPGKDHTYQIDGAHSHAATCTEDGVTTYVCSECGDSYEVKDAATGHVLTGEWTLVDEKVADAEVECLYHDVYENSCSKCQQKVQKTEDYISHTYITKIVKEATCAAKGEKQTVCKVCGDIKETAEIDINPDAHIWDEGTVSGNVTTYKCTLCDATKTSVVAEAKEIEVTSADFQAVEEVQLENAAMAFDDNAKGLLDGKDLKIEVGETKVSELPAEIVVDKEELNITDDTKVYDFSIIDKATGDAASFSGEGSGKVTVRLPYELQEGDDADALVIYYVAEGQVQEFDAKYENGYAVFETTHFSFYLVTHRTPAQVCEKLGHNWGETKEIKATCLGDGYKYHVCDRCGARETFDRVAATGHSFVADTEGAKEPTCTEPGYGGFVCENCGEHYGGEIPALGHDYVQTAVVAPTCTEPGSVTYVCSHDETHTYSIDIPAKGHTYEAKTTPATCQTEGKVEYICKDCGDVDASRTIVLEKIDHNYVLESEDEEKYVYQCSYCGDTYEVSKNADPLTQEYVISHSFFTNTGKSIADTDLSIVTDGFEFSIVVNGQKVSGVIGGSEAHIGANSAKQLEAYASATFSIDMGQKMEGQGVVYLVGDKAYLLGDAEQEAYMVYDLSSVSIGGASISVGDILNLFPQILAFAETDVQPFVEGIIDANAESINKTIYHLAEKLLSFKSTPTGYELSLDFDKLLALADLIATGSIEEVVDYLLGEGTVASLLDNLEQYVTLSFYDALAKLKTDIGLDYKELLKLIDKGVATFSDYESLRDLIYDKTNVDIDEYLTEEYLKAHSLSGLLQEQNVLARFIGDKTLAAFIKEDIANLLKENLYDVLMEKMGAPASIIETVKENIAKYIGIVKESGSYIVLKLGREGEYRSLNVFLNVEDEEIVLKGNLNVYFNKTYQSIFDYRSLESLCRSVGNVIAKEAFTSQKAIEAYFGQHNYIIEKDEDGNIVSIAFVEASSAPSYYGQDTSKYGTYIIETEADIVDLFNYTQYSFYDRLVELYNQYHEGNLIVLTYRDSYYRYDCDSFAPVTYNFVRVCGNKFDVSYQLGVKQTSYYNAVSVMVYNAAEELVYREILSERQNSYQSTYGQGYGAVDVVSEKLVVGGKSAHTWILVEADDPDEKQCGETVKVIYSCLDCGAVKDDSYAKQHTAGELVSYQLVKENGTCEDGVKLTYKCAECEEKFTTLYYARGGEHMYVVTDLYPCEGGANIRYQACACGRYGYIDIADSYTDGRTYTFYDPARGETLNDVEVYYPNDADPETAKPVLLYVYYANVEGSSCVYKMHLVAYEGVTIEEGGIAYEHRTDVEYRTAYSHNWVVKSLEYLDPEDHDKGVVYYSVCRDCGETGARYEYGLKDYLNLRYPLVDEAEYPYVGTYSTLYVYGYAGDIIEGRAEHVDVHAEQCEFKSEYREAEDKVWYELFSCIRSEILPDGSIKACTFRYAVFYNLTERVDECHVARFQEYRIGCDENGENAKTTFRFDYHVEESHDFEKLEDKILDTDSEYIKIVETAEQCKGCGLKHTSYAVKILDEANAEEVTVEKDGLTYVYPAGCYYANLDYATTYYAMDAEGHRIKEGYSRLYADCTNEGVYYCLYANDRTYGFYATEEGYGYGYSLSNIDSTSYYFLDSQKTVENSSGTRYYYPYADLEAFSAIFKLVTSFDYNLEKFGCYRVIEEFHVSPDYNQSVARLEASHIALVGESSCTQPSHKECIFCHKVVEGKPEGHKFAYEGDEIYRCVICGTLAANPNNGSLILEDLTEGNELYVVIGFYSQDYGASATLADLQRYYDLEVYGEVLDLNYYHGSFDGRQLEIVDEPQGGKILISKESLRNAIAKSGVNVQKIKQIRICFYLPRYGDQVTIVFLPEELGYEVNPDQPDYPYEPDQPTYIYYYVKSDDKAVMERYGDAYIALRAGKEEGELTIEADGFHEAFYIVGSDKVYYGLVNPENVLEYAGGQNFVMFDAELNARINLFPQGTQPEDPDDPYIPEDPDQPTTVTMTFVVKSEDERVNEKYANAKIVAVVSQTAAEFTVQTETFHEVFLLKQGQSVAQGQMNPENRLVNDENQGLMMYDAELGARFFLVANETPVEPDDPYEPEEPVYETWYIVDLRAGEWIDELELVDYEDGYGKQYVAYELHFEEGQEFAFYSNTGNVGQFEIEKDSFGGQLRDYLDSLGDGWCAKQSFDANFFWKVETDTAYFQLLG